MKDRITFKSRVDISKNTNAASEFVYTEIIIRNVLLCTEPRALMASDLFPGQRF